MDNRQDRQDRQDYSHSSVEIRVRYTGSSKEDRDRDLEKAIALFKKNINRDGILQEVRDRRYFRTNAIKLREKRQKALQRARDRKKKSRNYSDYNDRKDFRK